MTPEEWAEVFKAGAYSIPGKHTPPGEALGLALMAMSVCADEIAERGTS